MHSLIGYSMKWRCIGLTKISKTKSGFGHPSVIGCGPRLDSTYTPQNQSQCRPSTVLWRTGKPGNIPRRNLPPPQCKICKLLSAINQSSLTVLVFTALVRILRATLNSMQLFVCSPVRSWPFISGHKEMPGSQPAPPPQHPSKRGIYYIITNICSM